MLCSVVIVDGRPEVKTKLITIHKHAFVIRLYDLEKLWKLLEAHIGTVTASAECSDEMEREFDAWEELASYDNPPAKKIIRLSIESRSDDWKRFVHIRFIGDIFVSTVILIRAQEQLISEIKDKISDTLDGTKPWYSFLARFGSYLLVALSWVILWVLYWPQGLSEIILSLPAWETLRLPVWSPFVVLIGFTILLVLIGSAILIYADKGLRKPWSWLFPVGYFAIGQGERRYEIGERIRLGIIIGLPLSFVASLLVSLVW